jgi:hypothetical protein
MNKVVLIMYEDNGVFLIDESQFTAAVDDLAARMKKTVENMDMKALIRKQSNMMLHFLNSCEGEKSKEFSVDLEMEDAERENFSLSIVLKLNSLDFITEAEFERSLDLKIKNKERCEKLAEEACVNKELILLRKKTWWGRTLNFYNKHKKNINFVALCIY